MATSAPVGKRSRVIGSALARVVRHQWGCLDCAGEFGAQCRASRCEVCNPPRRMTVETREVEQ